MRHLTTVTGLALALLLGATAAASAQLSGVTSATFFVGVSDTSKECGVEQRGVEQALKLPIRAYTKIKEETSQAVPIDIQVVVESMKVKIAHSGFSPGCVHYVRVEVDWFGSVRLNDPSIPDGMHIVKLWFSEAMLSGPSDESSRAVVSTVEEKARDLASQWQKDNR
jgi:hypothetical protein